MLFGPCSLLFQATTELSLLGRNVMQRGVTSPRPKEEDEEDK